MHHVKAITIAAACFASSAIAAPRLEARQNGQTCQTSDASPYTEDVTAAINEVRGGGGSCPNTNPNASSESFGRKSLSFVQIH